VGQAQQHADRLMAAAKESLGADQQVSATVADGRSIEEAVEALDWEDGEVVMIGSSRLAQHSRLFLGSTANRMLRSLPVPMVVVPRNYEGPVGGDEEVTL
jgi:nucleotide-binding universal stress UspA family protein